MKLMNVGKAYFLPRRRIMSRCLLCRSHSGERSVANVKRHMESFCSIMSIKAPVLKAAAAPLIRESPLLIRIRTARVELLWRWNIRRHPVHHRRRGTRDIVHRRFPSLHRQRVQFHRRRDVARIVLAAHRNAFELSIRFQRRVFVGGFEDRVFGRSVLRLFDAQTLRRVLLVAELQNHREALFMRRSLLANQPILVLDLVESRQLVHQAHRRFLFRVGQRLNALLCAVTVVVAQNRHRRNIFFIRADNWRFHVLDGRLMVRLRLVLWQEIRWRMVKRWN